MTAEVHLSLAQVPGVRLIGGYQAMCNDDACAKDPVGVWGGKSWYRWWGQFEEKWIMAKIEATAHNLERHG